MKKLIVVILTLMLVGCSQTVKNKDGLVINPLEITIEEEAVILKLDKDGVVYQNEKALGKIIGNKIQDLNGEEVFSLGHNHVLFDANKDTVEDFSNKRTFIDDGMWLDLKWSDLGELVGEDGNNPGIQVLPNDSTLYRTASTILLFAERMKK